MTQDCEYVYFIRDRLSYAIKIGRTNNLKSRMSSLQNGNPHKLEPLIAIETQFPKDLEADFHRVLNDHKILNEWFSAEAVYKWLDDMGVKYRETPKCPFELSGDWNTDFDIWTCPTAEKHYYEKYERLLAI